MSFFLGSKHDGVTPNSKVMTGWLVIYGDFSSFAIKWWWFFPTQRVIMNFGWFQSWSAKKWLGHLSGIFVPKRVATGRQTPGFSLEMMGGYGQLRNRFTTYFLGMDMSKTGDLRTQKVQEVLFWTRRIWHHNMEPIKWIALEYEAFHKWLNGSTPKWMVYNGKSESC